MKKHRVGLSTNGKPFGRQLFEDYARAGIDCMEVSLEPAELERLDFAQAARWAADTGVEMRSVHLPFYPFEENDLSSLSGAVRTQTLAAHRALMDRAAAAGVRLFVVHPSAEPIGDGERAQRLAAAAETLSLLADAAEQTGAVVAVENLPRTCLGRDRGEMLRLTADERLKICFDPNHLLREEPVPFVRRVGKRLATTHFSDYDRLNERHWLPGEGVIDWQALMNALDEAGYAGPVVYEVGYKAPPTIRRPRDLRPEDFALNARELMQGDPFTVQGVPVREKCTLP